MTNSQTTYELKPDPLDPGWVIYSALCTEMQTRLRIAEEAATERAFDRIVANLFGPPARAKGSRGWVAWNGLPGSPIPETVLKSSSHNVTVRASRPRAATIGTVSSVEGVTRDQRVASLSCRVLSDSPTATDIEVDELTEVRFELCLTTVSPDSIEFPGLAWNIPAAITTQIQSVRMADTPLRWTADRCGRLMIPPQRVRLSSTADTYSLVVRVTIPAGDVRHLGRAWLNMVPIRVAGLTVLPANALTSEREGPQKQFQVVQPFACEPGLPSETIEEWRYRTACSVRNGDRIVTQIDVEEWLARMAPHCVPIQIDPARVRRNGEFQDAIRVCLIPRRWETPVELLRRSIVEGKWVERITKNRTALGVNLVAGPPTLRIVEPIDPLQELWPYRDFVISDVKSQFAFRSDGTFWPVWTVEELRGRRAE